MNRLYYGDCLTIIREHLRKDSVDLIYLDPPFNSSQAYNAIYKTATGKPLPDQIEAFCDTWTLDEQRERAIQTMPILMREAGIDDQVTEFWKLWMNALRNTNPRLLAYLSYMVERLIWMKGILKPTGSLYLHCDQTASHYIKVMLDAIFGHNNFRRELIWDIQVLSGFKTQANNWIRGHDTLFYYVKGNRFTFNKQSQPHRKEYLDRFNKVDKKGRAYFDGRGKRRYLDEVIEKGKAVGDVWSDIMSFQQIPTSKEKLGYATQKPLALLKRIVAASSNPGDVVLDPFCGCATTLEAAHKLNRRWIGIDIAVHAVKRVAAVRLSERLGLVEGTDFRIEGIPRTVEGAKDLWERDKYHFQKWAVEQSGGFVTNRRSADGGIDGRIYFDSDDPKTLDSMILEVKGGQTVTAADLRSLRGALADSGASMAGLIVRVPLGKRQQTNFVREMAKAGFSTLNGHEYPKLQIRTVEQILAGKQFDTPAIVGKQQTLQQPLFSE